MSSSRQTSLKNKNTRELSDQDQEANEPRNDLISRSKRPELKRNPSDGRVSTGNVSPLKSPLKRNDVDNDGSNSASNLSKRKKSLGTKDISRSGRDKEKDRKDDNTATSPDARNGRSKKEKDEEEVKQKEVQPALEKKTTKRPRPADTSADFKGLSQEYPSFELLWFDIMTKSRHLIQEIMDPIVDRLVQQKDTQNQMQANQSQMSQQVQELKDTIYNTGSKLDIFEKINQRMSGLDADRRVLEEKVDYQNSVLTTKMDNTQERLDVNQKLFDNMQIHTKQVQAELIELKNTYRQHSEKFVAEIKALNDQLIKYVNETHLTCEQLQEVTKSHQYQLNSHLNEIDTLKARATFVEQDNKELRQIAATLELVKLTKAEFQKKTKKMDLKALEHDIKLFKAQNHCSTLDNYLEKYMPIHVQTMINDTLMSTLGGRERRRLELYDSDKNSLLYQQLLLDDGTGKVQELMRELHEKASAEIEKQEKLRKRRMAIAEASKTNPNLEAEDDEQQNENDQQMQEDPKSASAGTAQSPTKLPKQHSSKQENSANASAPQTQGNGVSEEEIAEPQLRQNTSKSKKQVNRNMIVNSAAPALPNIVLDDFVYRLTDLINSDFKMPESDKDYELTHAQLIKISKILLYKLNLVSKKNAYEREELANMINDRVTSIENLTKSSLEEVNTFLHTVHQDFEHFLTKHKREHTDLNMKVMRTQDELNGLSSVFNETKKSVESYATILSCMVEFNSIEQCLSLQDEEDRHQISLVGRNKISKVPEDPFSGSPQNQSIFSQVGLKDDLKAIGVRGDRKQYFNQPIKGLKLSGSAQRNFGQRNGQSLHVTPQHGISVNTDVDDLKEASVSTGHNLLMSQTTPMKAGPITLDSNCLSCTGQPSHLMQLFKIACLSYNPSRVIYRKSNLSRVQLMQMRRTLIEKCEEVINTQRVFMNLQEGQDLRTAKLFKDLLQFHTGERSQPEIILSQDSIVSTNPSQNYSANFIPAISQKNFKIAQSNETLARGQQQFVNIVHEESQGQPAGIWSTSLLKQTGHQYGTTRQIKGENVKLPQIQ